MLAEPTGTTVTRRDRQPLAHGLLRSLLNNTSGDSSRLIRQMATRAGVTA